MLGIFRRLSLFRRSPPSPNPLQLVLLHLFVCFISLLEIDPQIQTTNRFASFLLDFHCSLMSFLYMGFSCEDDSDKKGSIIPALGESRETRHRDSVEKNRNGMESDAEFWPIKHPIEPLDGDQPVKCPMPDSSVINDGRMREEQFLERLQKSAELSAEANKGMMEIIVEPPVRAVRKRHHTLILGDDTTSPLLRMPPLYNLPPRI